MCSKNIEPTEECNINVDTIDFSFGIDYEDPDKYIVPGEQSDLSDIYLEEVITAIDTPENTIDDILLVCHWVNQNFSFENAGGNMIGKVTVDELFEAKKFYGCHSQALIISSILRKLGFPAILIETADVQWGYDYHDGDIEYFAGHVMSEIYVADRWILFDNNCTYVENYDPSNPYIPTIDYPPDAYFVFAKGLDTWDYSEKNESFSHEQLVFFSENIYCFEDLFSTVTYTWSN